MMWQSLSSFLHKKRISQPYRALFDQEDGDIISLDCETTSIDIPEAELLSIAAVKIRENRILTSESFQVIVQPKQVPDRENVRIHGLRPSDVREGLSPTEAVQRFLSFIGGRTLIGYYLDYDIAILEKYLRPLIGASLPNRKFDISTAYYDWRQRLYPGSYIDLRWDIMAERLEIPALPRHDAMNDAITAGMMYLALKRRSHRFIP